MLTSVLPTWVQWNIFFNLKYGKYNVCLLTFAQNTSIVQWPYKVWFSAEHIHKSFLKLVKLMAFLTFSAVETCTSQTLKFKACSGALKFDGLKNKGKIFLEIEKYTLLVSCISNF